MTEKLPTITQPTIENIDAAGVAVPAEVSQSATGERLSTDSAAVIGNNVLAEGNLAEVPAAPAQSEETHSNDFYKQRANQVRSQHRHTGSMLTSSR